MEARQNEVRGQRIVVFQFY